MQNKKKMAKKEDKKFVASSTTVMYFKTTKVWVNIESMIGPAKDGNPLYFEHTNSQWVALYSYKAEIIPFRATEDSIIFRNPSGSWKIFRKLETAQNFMNDYFVEKHGKMYAKPQTGKQKVTPAKKKSPTKPTPRKRTK